MMICRVLSMSKITNIVSFSVFSRSVSEGSPPEYPRFIGYPLLQNERKGPPLLQHGEIE
jgi:hypothetical protein